MPDPLPDVTPEVIDRVEAAAVADGSIADPSVPSAPTNEVTPASPATPEGAVTEGTPAEADSFTRLDPNALPEEVRPYYASMQGDYTRKMQEAAPWRSLGEELGVDDPDAIRQAVQLYAHLQDESNLRDFAGKLASELGIVGQPQAATDPASGAVVDDLDLESPGLKAYDDRMAQLESRLQQYEQQAAVERFMMAKAGETARQEALLAEQHPDWKQEDWDAVYNLAPAFDGNLVDTANALEEFASARMANYLNGKASVAETPGLQPAPPVRAAEVPHEVSGEEDPMLYGAGKEAAAYLRNLLNQSE